MPSTSTLSSVSPDIALNRNAKQPQEAYRLKSNMANRDEKHIEQRHEKGKMGTDSDSEAEEVQTYSADPSLRLNKQRTHTIGILKLRARDDTDPTDWWFASTAVPLIAATFAPMANMLSIAALVVPWRNNVQLPVDPTTKYMTSKGYDDPKWCLYLNAASLACGFIGNLFLLFNFTKRVRYIIALPLTIIFFYIASGILIAIIVCMDKYAAPGEDQVYSQGFWHAVIAACLYLLNSMILMVNMWGYFLGHYPQNFTLNDEHRNLILQTMLFFLWLAGGAGVFARTETWTYPDALYFCDVTILTIGFGDLYAQDDLARGLVFPYSVGGTIILGLMVSSIHKFARELSKEKIVRKHVETRRVNTLSRAVTMEQLDDNRLKRLATGQKMSISRPSQKDSNRIQEDFNKLVEEETLRRRAVGFQDPDVAVEPDKTTSEGEPLPSQFFSSKSNGGIIKKSLRTLTMPIVKPVAMTTGGLRRVLTRHQKQILMVQERDRFNAMRSVQTNASKFNRYYALSISVVCFGMLWCLGAMVFYFAESDTQHLNYFQGLYFCYVSLLTIGYGDLSPKSNAGKAFFVVWSLIAVPTMTILISDLGDTVIGGFKRGVLKNDLGLTSKSNDSNSPSSFRSLLARLFRQQNSGYKTKQQPPSRKPSELEAGKEPSTAIELDENGQPIDETVKTIEELANEEVSEAEMMRRLAFAIRQVADDIKAQPGKKYSYEEWVQFTRLIKFSKFDKEKLRSGEASAMKQLEYDEAMDGVVEWDWLDANSPMTSEQSESEWVLDRLCESLLRVFKKSDLVLGGLSTGKVVHEPGKPSNEKVPTSSYAFGRYAFGQEGERSPSPPASPPLAPQRRISEGAPRSPDVMTKMTRFFQGDNADDDTPQWSKRAKAKMAHHQTVEELEPRDSYDRRRSFTVAPIHRRQGPFAGD